MKCQKREEAYHVCFHCETPTGIKVQNKNVHHLSTKCSSFPAFTSLTFAVTIVVPKEVFAIVAGDFFARYNVAKHLFRKRRYLTKDLDTHRLTIKIKQVGILFEGVWIPFHLNACSVSASGDEFTVWSAIVVDVGRCAQPQLNGKQESQKTF